MIAAFWHRPRPYETHPGVYHLSHSHDPSFPGPCERGLRDRLRRLLRRPPPGAPVPRDRDADRRRPHLRRRALPVGRARRRGGRRAGRGPGRVPLPAAAATSDPATRAADRSRGRAVLPPLRPDRGRSARRGESAARIAWSDSRSGDSEITVAGRLNSLAPA